MFEEAAHVLAPLGVVVGATKLDHAALMKHKNESVAANVNGVAFLSRDGQEPPATEALSATLSGRQIDDCSVDDRDDLSFLQRLPPLLAQRHAREKHDGLRVSGGDKHDPGG